MPLKAAQELDEAEQQLWDVEMQDAFRAADAARERYRQEAEVRCMHVMRGLFFISGSPDLRL